MALFLFDHRAGALVLLEDLSNSVVRRGPLLYRMR